MNLLFFNCLFGNKTSKLENVLTLFFLKIFVYVPMYMFTYVYVSIKYKKKIYIYFVCVNSNDSNELICFDIKRKNKCQSVLMLTSL